MEANGVEAEGQERCLRILTDRLAYKTADVGYAASERH